MGVKDVSARWLKASMALKKEDQIYGQKLAEMARKHSSEAFYALDDIKEVVFSVLRWYRKKKRLTAIMRSIPCFSPCLLAHQILNLVRPD